MRTRRGIALATALLLIVFLFVVGAALLAVIERDLRFTSQQANAVRAWYMALSGLEYHKVHRYDLTAGTTVSKTVQPLQSFEVVRDAAGTVRSRGIITDDRGRVLAQRVAVLPNGEFVRMYEAAP